jgi:iron(II)-dependent oxidoreductase
MQTTQLIEWIRDARQRTMDIVDALAPEQLFGPRLAIINPLLWEIGHVAWFQEKWVLRGAGKQPPLRADADSLYDSTAIPHDIRWDLPLPSREETLVYLRTVRDRVLERIESGRMNDAERYFILLSVFHEDMHTEAFTYTRQTLSYPAPVFTASRGEREASGDSAGALPGDVEIPGGRFLLGAFPDEAFVFDNEKWAHPVEVRPFAIARATVTQAEFSAFVEDRGYHRRELWSEEGWRWREKERAECPVYWKPEANGRWLRRDFNRWIALEPHRPMLHVNWWEAEAYCAWAGRRLPTEVEWEVAAAAEPASGGHALAGRKRRFPWGNDPPASECANLGWHALGTVDVAACGPGDSAFGCRQMIGNIWDWTVSDFEPYPGFSADPYQEYSQPWFGGTHKVLRGGAFATRSRLIRTTYRNFYTPDRRDVLAGFRTCRL